MEIETEVDGWAHARLVHGAWSEVCTQGSPEGRMENPNQPKRKEEGQKAEDTDALRKIHVEPGLRQEDDEKRVDPDEETDPAPPMQDDVA
jgi:hypothetical protein